MLSGARHPDGRGTDDTGAVTASRAATDNSEPAIFLRRGQKRSAGWDARTWSLPGGTTNARAIPSSHSHHWSRPKPG